jgi:hypothetical protein
VGGINIQILAVHFLFTSRSWIHGLFIYKLYVNEMIRAEYRKGVKYGVFGSYANIPIRFSISHTTARRWIWPLASSILLQITYSLRNPFIIFSVSRQAHSLFQREFFTEHKLLLPLSNSSILLFAKVIQLLLTPSLSSFHHFYPSRYQLHDIYKCQFFIFYYILNLTVFWEIFLSKFCENYLHKQSNIPRLLQPFVYNSPKSRPNILKL